MKRIIFCLFVLTAIYFASCAPVKSSADYAVSLIEVESPKDAKIQYGETKVVNFEEGGIGKYRYEDDYINIVWYVETTKLHFALMNKTPHTLRINWDDISYVNHLGQVERVVHSGIEWHNINHPQPPTNIPAGAGIKDILVPINCGAIVPYVYNTPEDFNAENGAISYVGKILKVMMPIMIENVQNDYVYTFRIDELLNSVSSRCKIVSE